MVQNVILDWSGTLVDDLKPVWKTTNHVFSVCGLPPVSLDEFRSEFCLPVRRYYERLVPHIPTAELERIFLQKYPEYRNEIRLLPDTLGFLQFCALRRMNVFIASSVDTATYESLMARFGLVHYITKAYLGIEDKTVKIHQILDENRLNRNETLFVGDMEHDIAAGQAGGVRTCAVLSGYNHSETLQAQKPDLLCLNLGELQKILMEDGGRFGCRPSVTGHRTNG